MADLFDACRLAPTGSNMQNVGIMVLRDRQKIEKLIDLTVDYYRKVIPLVEKKLARFKKQGKPIPQTSSGHGKEVRCIHISSKIES